MRTVPGVGVDLKESGDQRKKSVKESLANPKSTMERGKVVREIVYMPKGYPLRSSIRH